MFKENLKKITIKIFYIIIAVLVSITLWMYVEITENEVQIREISGIEFVFIHEDVLRGRGLSRTSVETDALAITFEAPRTIISRLSTPGALTAEVDLASVTSAGTITLAYDLIFPAGITINDVDILGSSDSRITLVIDRSLERQVPVKVNYTGGTASEDLIAEAVDFDPLTVTVRGPERAVSRVNHVRVPILIENLASTYTDYLEFIPYDDNNEPLDDELRELIEFSQETIRVTIAIKEIREVALAVELFHGLSTSSGNTRVSLTPQVITVMGDPEAVRDLNNIILGTIDMLSFSRTDTFEFPINVPEHIINLSGETTAQALVEVLGLDIAFRSITNIQYVNVPSGYRAEIVTQSLDVRLRGESDDLDLITPLNIRVVADLSERGPGTSRVPARVYIDGLEPDMLIDPVGEYLITVSIVEE